MILAFSINKLPPMIRARKVTLSVRKNAREVGSKIQFWHNFPRNKNKNPWQFGQGKVVKVEKFNTERRNHWPGFVIYLDNSHYPLSHLQISEFLQKEGLTFEEFRQWFFSNGQQDYKGYCIHWDPDECVFWNKYYYYKVVKPKIKSK